MINILKYLQEFDHEAPVMACLQVRCMFYVQGEYRFEGPAFPTIQELITYQYQSKLPVTSRSGAILRTPVPRELWELNNDDLLLLDKIGRVSTIRPISSL